MAPIGTTFWYGSFHKEEERGTAHLLPGLAWTAFIVILAGWRLLLPYTVVDPATIHNAILDSLVADQTWGRQALVGSPEFPLLTTVSLLFARTFGGWLNMPAAHVLVTAAQVWAFVYLLRMPESFRSRLLLFAILLCAFAGRPVRSVVFALDPNWIAAVPATAALYHAVQWHRHRALRDPVLLAVNCAILVFAGPAGAAVGLVLLTMTALHLQQLKGAEPAADFRGIAFLLWMPFAYCAALLFLANWLILRDPFFVAHRIVEAFRAQPAIILAAEVTRELTQTPWLVCGAVVVAAIHAVKGRPRIMAATILAATLLLTGSYAALAAASLHVAGAHILLLVLALAGLTAPAFQLGRPTFSRRTRGAIAAAVAVALGLAAAWPNANYSEHVNAIGKHPHRRDLTGWIDRSWSNARIMVYGVKAPAIYGDVKEKRFVPRIDYSDEAFLWRARTEQLYLLVPPRTGQYYPERHNPMAMIHEHGKPWLLLEKQWPPGWQLWRCVVLPDSNAYSRTE